MPGLSLLPPTAYWRVYPILPGMKTCGGFPRPSKSTQIWISTEILHGLALPTLQNTRKMGYVLDIKPGHYDFVVGRPFLLQDLRFQIAPHYRWKDQDPVPMHQRDRQAASQASR